MQCSLMHALFIAVKASEANVTC